MHQAVSTTDEYIEAVVDDEDDKDDIAFENERCGICTDIIIDRGVLDCCDHWFCFSCIDNWATITNCCPICKNEFQLITCLPVFDTTGSIRVENGLLFRDDDWSVQGKNNTLSFPSYYINEDAVACLDGNGCRVRSGTVDNELTFDTSIACDSCDIWYHACCVGFQPECTSVSSWLCPRCLSIGEIQKIDHGSVHEDGKNFDLTSAKHGLEVDHSFLGKVSVSVADDGETAVVVSMVQMDQPCTDKKIGSFENQLEISAGEETETYLSDPNVVNTKNNVSADEIKCYSNDIMFKKMVKESENSYNILLDVSAKVVQKDDELEKVSSPLSLLKAPPFNFHDSTPGLLQCGLISPSRSLTHSSAEVNCGEETICSSTYNEHDDSFSMPCSSYQNISRLPQDEYGGLVDIIAKDPLVISRSLHSPEECNISVDGTITSSVEDVVNAIFQEDSKVADSVREHTVEFNVQKISSPLLPTDAESMSIHKGKRKLDTQEYAEDNAKKCKLDGTSLMSPLQTQVSAFIKDHSGSCPKAMAYLKDDDRKNATEDEIVPPDIMSIVREPDYKHQDGQTRRELAKKGINKRDDSTGVRVKKIMRRIGDRADKEIIVQKLGNEIKEAVQGKTSKGNVKDNAFHGELLTAFREAILKPSGEVANKFDPSLGLRKQLLKKGKTRENLTKKIYGTTSGRRKRAWDRDWEVEFWKYRCPKTNPEKIETLQSVLALLKKASTPCTENLEVEQGPEGDTTNSILSRVYLADASVFPRKDDIKPLSAVALTNSSLNDSQNVLSNVAKDMKLQIKDQTSNNQGKNTVIPEKSSSRGNIDVQKLGTSLMLASSTLKGKGQSLETSVPVKNEKILKDPENISSMAKGDKKKWAIEILARKNSLMSSSAVKDAQENGAMFKGNYPLLAQLPIDMRPVLASNRQNKIPTSVRQAQLHRLTEHYLRRTNLSVIQRTAEVELAVADAVNVEKEISERSNSKMVYVNLCSQVLSQCTKLQSDAIPCDVGVNSDSNADKADENTANDVDHAAKETISDPKPVDSDDVEEALRLAGLIDSPPTSPCRNMKSSDADADPLIKSGNQYMDNVLGIGTKPPLNPYAGSDNRLLDMSCSASSSIANSSNVSELENEIVKMKGLSSTLESEEPLKLIFEQPNDSSSLAQYNGNGCGKGNEHADVKLDHSAPTKLFELDEVNELCLAEHKELCAPQKEPPHKVSAEVIGETCKLREREASEKCSMENENEPISSRGELTLPRLETYCSGNNILCDKVLLKCNSAKEENSANSFIGEIVPESEQPKHQIADSSNSVYKKVEAYIKEHIRPLCKSGVITVEQYRWAVRKATDKVMGRHNEAKNANFLVKDGDKVKKLAEQYVEVAQQKMP